MMAEREERARAGENFILHTIAKRMLPEDEAKLSLRNIRGLLIETYDRPNVWDERHRGVSNSWCRLRWGIIANQPAECSNSLVRRGLLEFFDVVAISDERHLHKPDPALFAWALAEACCDPGHSVMIGDRRDNDMIRRTVRQMHDSLPLARLPQQGVEPGPSAGPGVPRFVRPGRSVFGRSRRSRA